MNLTATTKPVQKFILNSLKIYIRQSIDDVNLEGFFENTNQKVVKFSLFQEDSSKKNYIYGNSTILKFEII